MRDDGCLDLSLRSQNRNNESPAHVRICGKCIGNDTNTRQDFAYAIDIVSRNGKRLLAAKNLNTTRSYIVDPILYVDQFTMRVRTEELDNAGRHTLILCYGRVPEKPPSDWADAVVSEIQTFASSIGRTISNASAEETRRGLRTILRMHGSIWGRIVRFIGRFAWRVKGVRKHHE